MTELSDIPNIQRLGGTVVDLRRFTREDNRNWSATNPSIGRHPKKGYAVAIRSSNYVIDKNGSYKVTEGGKIKAEIWFSELDKDLKIKDLRRIDTSGFPEIVRGLEDPKLFVRDGSWYITCVTMEAHTPRARMAIARLDAKCIKIVELTKFPGIDSARPEKNWMLSYDKNPNFDFVYGPNSVVKDKRLMTWMTDNPDISALRGTTNLHSLGDGTYLAVTHRMFGKASTVYVPQTFGTVDTYLRKYVHYFTRYNNEGMIIGLSKGFNFYQPGVEFAGGIVSRGSDLLISFGREDVSSHIAILPLDKAIKMICSVNY